MKRGARTRRNESCIVTIVIVVTIKELIVSRWFVLDCLRLELFVDVVFEVETMSLYT